MNLVLIENLNINQPVKSFSYKMIKDKKIERQAIFDNTPLTNEEVQLFRVNPDALLSLYGHNAEPETA